MPDKTLKPLTMLAETPGTPRLIARGFAKIAQQPFRPPLLLAWRFAIYVRKAAANREIGKASRTFHEKRLLDSVDEYKAFCDCTGSGCIGVGKFADGCRWLDVV